MQYEVDFECIEQYLEKYAVQKPEYTAIIVKDTYTSYGELWRMVRGFARYLTETGEVQKGDRVVIKTLQTLDFAVSYFAVHLSGAVFVPLEKSIANEKALDILNETEAKVYISKDSIAEIPCSHVNIR